MERESIRRWVECRRAGERREHQELRGRATPSAEAIRDALGLVAFAGRRLGWPLPEDAVSIREREPSYECWARLRRGRRR